VTSLAMFKERIAKGDNCKNGVKGEVFWKEKIRKNRKVFKARYYGSAAIDDVTDQSSGRVAQKGDGKRRVRKGISYPLVKVCRRGNRTPQASNRGAVSISAEQRSGYSQALRKSTTRGRRKKVEEDTQSKSERGFSRI